MIRRFTYIIYICVDIYIHSLNEIVPLGVIMLPKWHRLSDKNPSTRHQKHPVELLARETRDTPQAV